MIDVELSKGRQSLNYQEIVKIGDDKVRIRIKSDSYDFQSYARIEVWGNENKWNNIHNIPFANMATPPELYYHSNANKRSFKVDRDKLIDVATSILN
jgi:hypothetical protein